MKNKELKTLVEGKNEVKLRDIINGLESLKILSEQKLPVFTSFKVSLFIKNVNPIIETYGKERNKLIQELGTLIKDKDGKETGNYNFSKENGKEFNEKINTILDENADIKTPVLALKELEGISIEPKYLSNLTWMICE